MNQRINGKEKQRRKIIVEEQLGEISKRKAVAGGINEDEINKTQKNTMKEKRNKKEGWKEMYQERDRDRGRSN